MENRIYSPRDLVSETANLRQELARAMEVLALPIPDTFLARLIRERAHERLASVV